MNTGYKKVTITLPKKLQEKYKKLLESTGMSLSKRLAILIEEDYNKLTKIKNL